jgi:3-oxoacyl-(acyl-carrier-protein) synthase
VVVTGLSTFTSLGHDAHTFFDNLCEGKCGIGPVTNFNCDGLTPQTTHQVRWPSPPCLLHSVCGLCLWGLDSVPPPMCCHTCHRHR